MEINNIHWAGNTDGGTSTEDIVPAEIIDGLKLV